MSGRWGEGGCNHLEVELVHVCGRVPLWLAVLEDDEVAELLGGVALEEPLLRDALLVDLHRAHHVGLPLLSIRHGRRAVVRV